MSKSINFFGQPIYGQLIKSLDREKIVEMSRAFRGRFCDPPKPCRKLRAGFRDSQK